jgi:hypothetical protein
VEERDQLGVLCLFLCDRMRSSTNGLGMGFTTFGSQSSGGGVSPCTVSAGRSRDLFLVCLFVCHSLWMRICSPGGLRLERG